MAALIMYSVIALQPSVGGWLERVKAQRDSRGRHDPTIATPPNAAKRLAANLPFGKNRKGKGKEKEEVSVPEVLEVGEVDAASVLHTLLLLLLVMRVKRGVNVAEEGAGVASSSVGKGRWEEEAGNNYYSFADEKAGYSELGGIAQPDRRLDPTRDAPGSVPPSQTVEDGGNHLEGHQATSPPVQWLEEEAPSEDELTVPMLAPPDDQDGEALPQYSLADPVKGGGQASSTHGSVAKEGISAIPSRTPSAAGLLWSLYLAQALSRLQMYCLEVLPAASVVSERETSSSVSSEPEGSSGKGLRDLPEYLLPPLDVCIAWAAILAGPGYHQIHSRGGLLPKLRGWSLPLPSIAALHSEEPGQASRDREESWTEDTETPFHLSNAALFDKDRNVLSDGLRICCPSPTCSAAAKVPFLGGAGGEVPSSRSRRGLLEPMWQRTCPLCDQKVCLDSLVGRKLITDIQHWCETSPNSYKDAAFPGLLDMSEDGSEEGGDSDKVHRAEDLASQVLSPLFSPAFSAERGRADEAQSTFRSVGDSHASPHSLGAAAPPPITPTCATLPFSLGASMCYSLSAIETWLLEKTLLMQREEKRSRLVSYVHALLRPYKRLAEEGLPSGQSTLEVSCDVEDEDEWTDVSLRLDTTVHAMVAMGREVEQWRDLIAHEEKQIKAATSNNVGSSTKQSSTSESGGSKGKTKKERQLAGPAAAVTAAPSGVSAEILKAYLATLSELSAGGTPTSNGSAAASRGRSGMIMSKREAMDLLNGEETPIEVRVARLAHELSKEEYEDDLKKYLGVAPRGLLGL